MGVDRITTGPLNAAGTDPYDSPGVLVLDQQNDVLEFVGKAGIRRAARKSIKIFQAQTALTAITTAQNLLTQALNAGALNVINRTLRVHGSVVFGTTTTNSATVTIALKIGSVTLVTITTGATDSGTDTNLNMDFDFTFSVAATGSSGTIEAHGGLKIQLGSTAAAAITEYLDAVHAVSSAVNLTSALTLAVTIAASAAIPSAQLRAAQIELVA